MFSDSCPPIIPHSSQTFGAHLTQPTPFGLTFEGTHLIQLLLLPSLLQASAQLAFTPCHHPELSHPARGHCTAWDTSPLSGSSHYPPHPPKSHKLWLHWPSTCCLPELSHPEVGPCTVWDSSQ